MAVVPDPPVLDLDEPPSLARLYAKAAAPFPGGPGDGGARSLPAPHVRLRGVELERDDVAAYADACGFRVTDLLPSTYLHLLAFPLQIRVMSEDEFPFPLLGMVHLRQRIEVVEPITAAVPVDVEVWLEGLRPHAKGSQFTVRSQVTTDGRVVWDGTSTYLARHAQDEEPTPEEHPADAVEVADLPLTAVWRLDGDVGRRYGRVSGDVNPIHMSALSAKAFGFPRAIAHGMWTMARSLAGLEGRLPPAVGVDVAFKTPLFVPGRATYATRAVSDGWEFGVRNDRNGKPHLAGVVVPRS